MMYSNPEDNKKVKTLRSFTSKPTFSNFEHSCSQTSVMWLLILVVKKLSNNAGLDVNIDLSRDAVPIIFQPECALRVAGNLGMVHDTFSVPAVAFTPATVEALLLFFVFGRLFNDELFMVF
jgi:hypothetical protein